MEIEPEGGRGHFPQNAVFLILPLILLANQTPPVPTPCGCPYPYGGSAPVLVLVLQERAEQGGRGLTELQRIAEGRQLVGAQGAGAAGVEAVEHLLQLLLVLVRLRVHPSALGTNKHVNTLCSTLP